MALDQRTISKGQILIVDDINHNFDNIVEVVNNGN